MKIGIIAGNRNLPILLAKRLSQNNQFKKVTGVCFRGETSRHFSRFVNKAIWVEVGKLGMLREAIKKEGIKDWIMAGQINPLSIFKKKKWDNEFKQLAGEGVNFCPHNIFRAVIDYLEKEGVKFINSTLYLKNDLAEGGLMNNLCLPEPVKQDLEFGVSKISKFVELDIGQTLVVKNKAVVASESLEGTDNTIKRGFRLSGYGAGVIKFAKSGQDLRFDVPVVGISTLKLLRKIRASFLVLQSGKTIVLEKDKFLDLSRNWRIPVIGA